MKTQKEKPRLGNNAYYQKLIVFCIKINLMLLYIIWLMNQLPNMF